MDLNKVFDVSFYMQVGLLAVVYGYIFRIYKCFLLLFAGESILQDR